MDKQRILLIEDDVFLLGMYSKKFELEGYEVIVADNGVDGLDAAKKYLPNIILLDILMPVMNGIEVLEHLKNNAVTADIPVILLTNFNQKDEVDKCFELGAKDFLVKAHFMPSEVVEKIKKYIK